MVKCLDISDSVLTFTPSDFLLAPLFPPDRNMNRNRDMAMRNGIHAQNNRAKGMVLFRSVQNKEQSEHGWVTNYSSFSKLYITSTSASHTVLQARVSRSLLQRHCSTTALPCSPDIATLQLAFLLHSANNKPHNPLNYNYPLLQSPTYTPLNYTHPIIYPSTYLSNQPTKHTPN